jgi:hypothetical protein
VKAGLDSWLQPKIVMENTIRYNIENNFHLGPAYMDRLIWALFIKKHMWDCLRAYENVYGFIWKQFDLVISFVIEITYT